MSTKQLQFAYHTYFSIAVASFVGRSNTRKVHFVARYSRLGKLTYMIGTAEPAIFSVTNKGKIAMTANVMAWKKFTPRSVERK